MAGVHPNPNESAGATLCIMLHDVLNGIGGGGGGAAVPDGVDGTPACESAAAAFIRHDAG